MALLAITAMAVACSPSQPASDSASVALPVPGDSGRLVSPDSDAAAAGATPTPDSATPGTGARQRSQEGDEAQIEKLEAEARALAKAGGCERSDQCRTAPLGSRPCGGPREYLVYCPLTTDSATLFKKLGELEAAEKAYNAKNQMMGTCEMRMPPEVEVVAKLCRAVGGGAR